MLFPKLISFFNRDIIKQYLLKGFSRLILLDLVCLVP